MLITYWRLAVVSKSCAVSSAEKYAFNTENVYVGALLAVLFQGQTTTTTRVSEASEWCNV